MLQFYTSLADKLYARRWWFAGTAATVFVLLLVLIPTNAAEMLTPAGLLSGPLIAVSWGLLCMCVWFHPTRGKLYSGSLFDRLPGIVKTVIRWYFAVFLTIWFAFGLLVWPTFVLWGERLTTRWSGP